MNIIFIFVFLVIVQPNQALYSDEDNALLPNLFHLDDHDRCLLQPRGLYCLGEFDLAPIGTSVMYENIKRYASNNPGSFNRSRLYRGYCVSTRCPGKEKNASLRFEQCVDKRARRYSLSARLRKLQYCTTQQQHAAKAQQPPDAAQQLFLQVVCAILVLNIVGTVYDAFTGDVKIKKNGLITAWSVRASWQRLTATYDNGDPRLRQLEPLQGARVVVMLLSIYAHCCMQHIRFYVSNPNALEIIFNRIDTQIVVNGTSIIQGFVIISTFLASYSLLLYSEKNSLKLLMLPVLILKRITRLAPVHLLLVGFTATNWSALRSGALSPVIEEYGVACRRKYWAHALFLNNIVEMYDNTCLVPSWFLPVDMHLFTVSCALTIVTYRWKYQALRLYATLFLISTVGTGVIAYVMGYRALAYETAPENLREIFTSKSFGAFYTSSWGSLPACFVGLFFSHLHYSLQGKYDWNHNKWFKRLHPLMIVLFVVGSATMGLSLRGYTQPWVAAFYVAVERPLFSCILFLILLGIINIDGFLSKLFGWRGWRVPARLSLPVMMSHWIVCVVISARPTAYHTSTFDMIIDYLATLFYSYAVSVPVALLVEIPVQRFFAQIF